MTDEPGLFSEPGPVAGQEIQLCDGCLTPEVGTFDHLRARGWAALIGESLTGKPLEIRLCPACRRENRGDHDAARDELAGLPEVPDLPAGLW